MNRSPASGHQGLRATSARPAILWLLLALSAVWPRVSDAYARDLDLGIAEHTGGYVLELDAPSPRTRGKCVEVVVSNFGALAERKLWLVARTVDRALASVTPVYEMAILVDAPAKRVGIVPVCLPPAPEAGRGQGYFRVVTQVALYRVTARDLAAGHWPGPVEDGLRLSNWLALPDTLLRSRMPVADRSSKSRTGSADRGAAP